MEIGMVAAVSLNGIIGSDGKIPWPFYKEDMAHMHRIIDGSSIIMGRRTYEGLPHTWDCNYFVVSGQLAIRRKGEFSFKEGVATAMARHPSTSIYALGGTRIFNEAFRFATKLYLTRIQDTYHGDTYFPAIPPYWQQTAVRPCPTNSKLVFETWENLYVDGLPVPLQRRR